MYEPDRQDERSPSSPRRWVPIAALVAIAALAVGGYLYAQRTDEHRTVARPGSMPSAASSQDSPEAESHDSQPVDVQVTKPTRRELIYSVTLPANVSPHYQTTLYAKVSAAT